MSRRTDLIAKAKAKDADLGKELEHEFKALSSPRRAATVLYHTIRRLFGLCKFGSHLHSFVITTRTKPSLNQNLSSVP